MNRPRQPRTRSVRRAGLTALSAAVAISALPATAVADATDDYPIPQRMIDKHNKSPQVQQTAIDNAHYFYSLNPADRRAYSEQMVTNFADPITAAWPNWGEDLLQQ